MSAKAKTTGPKMTSVAGSGVVVSSAGTYRSVHFRLAAITSGCVILLIVVVGLVVLVLGHRTKKEVPLTTATSLSAVSAALTSGDTATAKQQLANVKPKTQAEQEELWSYQAAIAHNSGDYKMALEYYQKLLAAEPNNGDFASNAASEAAATGDKVLAAKYYQQAISILNTRKAEDKTYDSDLKYLQTELAEVQS